MVGEVMEDSIAMTPGGQSKENRKTVAEFFAARGLACVLESLKLVPRPDQVLPLSPVANRQK